MMRIYAPLLALVFVLGCSEKESTQNKSPASESPTDVKPAEAEPPVEPDPKPEQAKITEEPQKKSNAEPGSLRLVVVSKEAPIRSVARDIAELSTKLGKIEVSEPSDEERAYVVAVAADPSASVPNLWSDTELVILIGVNEPHVSKKGKRSHGGYGTLMIVHGGNAKPIYRENSADSLFDLADITKEIQVELGAAQ